MVEVMTACNTPGLQSPSKNGQADQFKELVKKMVIQGYQKHAEDWLTVSTNKDKTGLLLIKAIIKYHGAKRFRPRQQVDLIQTPVAQYITQSKSQANRYLNQMAFGTTYEKFLGKESLHPTEADILKYKKLKELEFTIHFEPLILNVLQNWVNLKDDNYYVTQVVTVLRNMHTFMKNLQPYYLTRNNELYLWPKHHQLVKQEKIKKMEDEVRAQSAMGNAWTSFNSRYGNVMKEMQVMQRRNENKDRCKSELSGKLTLQNPSEVRQQLIRGNGNILDSGYITEKNSLYRNTYVNLQQLNSKVLGRPSSRIDLSQSCSIGVVVPDPVMLSRLQKRERDIHTSLGFSRGSGRTSAFNQHTNLLMKLSKQL